MARSISPAFCPGRPVVKTARFLYNTMMLKPKYIALWTTLALLVPTLAQAYLSPYEVLVSPELVWPTRPRESEAKVQWQQEQSALRREAEQQANYDAQHPAAETASSAPSSTAASSAANEEEDALDPELKSLLRALERLQENQEKASLRAEALSMLREEGLMVVPEETVHGSAGFLETGKGLPAKGKGPLTPSGAGSTLAIMVGLTAIGWTFRRTTAARAVTR